MTRKITTIFALMLLAGCATTEPTSQQNSENSLEPARAELQAQQTTTKKPDDIVITFMNAHGAVMAELTEVKSANRQTKSDLADLKADNQQVLAELEESKTTNQKALETAQHSLQLIEELSNRQGTGEITIFFTPNSASIKKGSLEYERLVHFADFLARENKGRRIIFLSIGSASTTGSKKKNLRLARQRSEAPLDILDKYLINIPHEFYKVYGSGDLYSPKDVAMKEQQRYQHTRIIALFDTTQAPPVHNEAK